MEIEKILNESNLTREELSERISSEIVSQLPELLLSSEKERLKTIMEILMKAERNIHIANNPSDKGNGYRNRKVNSSLGQIELKVPRDRDGDFYPTVLPGKYQRFGESYSELLNAGLNNFYSRSSMKCQIWICHIRNLSWKNCQMNYIKNINYGNSENCQEMLQQFS